jgi:hypothetical protein
MTIQITRPEVEELIKQRLESGTFKDAEDVILQALQSSPPPQPLTRPAAEAKNLDELFAPVRGLFEDGELDFSRNPSVSRPVDLS